MKIEYGSHCYLIKFHHEIPGQEEKTGYRTTVCKVIRTPPLPVQPFSSRFKASNQEGLELISTGTARCSPLDQFSKETGRKLSLTRALQEIAPSLDKNLRAAIWRAYFDRKKESVQA